MIRTNTHYIVAQIVISTVGRRVKDPDKSATEATTFHPLTGQRPVLPLIHFYKSA